MIKRLWPDMSRQSCQVFPVYSIRTIEDKNGHGDWSKSSMTMAEG